ncbi:serine/threonine-protein kinase pelle-like isoform X2 [Macrosteles quadrilineatus]|uniref:serine/threonine-protein kinase pelle-like isoform X2 n=1 Tax=Macrosteles quadrilineatus TaxID=74068 RepID=UPI0023E0BECE|nr:serine/threonine-protein kinase pelle-like isoform X2 [Macrosteles quadrilineatus]
MSKKIFVYELPYTVRTNFCRLLESQDKWEELGGEHMNFDYDYLQYIRRKSSPADELLTSWGNQNHTVNELFVLLSKMQFYRAMRMLKDLVDERYHHLLREGEELMSRPISKTLAEGVPSTVRQGHRVDLGGTASTCTLRETLPHQPLPRASGANGKNAFKDNKDLGLNLDNLNLYENKGAKKAIHEVKIQNMPNARNAHQAEQNCNNNNDFSTGQAQAAYNPNYNPNLLPPGEGSDLHKLGQQRKLSDVSLASSMMEGCTPQISYEELVAATNSWDTSCILGRGGFGTVYKGFWKNTFVAIKKLEPPKDQQNMLVGELNASQMTEVLRELKHLNSHRHDNILSLYGYCVSDNASCLVYQYMANGSLEDRLHCRNNSKPLNWTQRLNIMTGTARGIQFLHSLGKKPLVHGDIKSANILLDSNFEPRIGDFGLAREGPHQHYTHVKVSRVHGTKPYLPDEFLRAREFSVRVDTYSFGVVLFEAATGLRAYDENRKEKFLKDYIVSYPDNNLSDLADTRAGPDYCMSTAGLLRLGRCCVVTRPRDRPDMTTVLADVQMLYNNYKAAEKSTCLARQRSLTPTNPLEMQALHDEMRHPTPPPLSVQLPLQVFIDGLVRQRSLTPTNPPEMQARHDEMRHPTPPPLSVQLPLQVFIDGNGQQKLFLPPGMSLEEVQRITKMLPPSLGEMIVQPPPLLTVQPPSTAQPRSASPSQIEVFSPPVECDIPLLTALGVKAEENREVVENSENNQADRPALSVLMTSAPITSAQITSAPTSNGSISSSNHPSEALSEVSVDSQNGNVDYSDFEVSLPEENQSAYLPRLPDLLGR